MSGKNKKQFGVWMDSHHATLIGKADMENGNFAVLAYVENEVAEGKPSEKATNNAERMVLQKFFKEITSFMQNAEEIHVTGTGTAQEQFIHYLAETPQFKNTVANETTSNKMSDERLVEYISEKFH